MTVLITGADGQLAQALAPRMADQGLVVTLSRTQLDVTNDAAVSAAVREFRPEIVLNGAAYNDVDGAEENSVKAMSVNAFGVRSLARAARAVGATLVHFSTDFVFDGTAETPYTEEVPANPQSVYATSKLLGEWFAREADHYVLRVESLFGGSAVSSLDGRSRGSSIDRIADAILLDREVRAFYDRTVSPSFVEDVADATVSLLETGAPYGLYHCVGSGMGTWVEVVQELARCLKRSARIIPVSSNSVKLQAARPKFSALSNAKLDVAGISMPTWQDALARFSDRRLGAS